MAMFAEAYRALLIVNSTFPLDRHNLPNLEGPRNDAVLLRDALCHPEAGLFDPDAVRIVPERSMSEVLAETDDFLRNATEDETLLLYYSGHGMRGQRGELFLCTSDTRADRLLASAVPASTISQMIDESAARATIVVLDCCYSGRFKSGVTTEAFSGRGRFVVASSRGAELAHDTDLRNRASLFTHHLVEGLRREAGHRESDGLVYLSQVYDYVHTALASEGRQIPTRDFAGQGDVPIARRVPAAEAEPQPVLELSEQVVDLGEVESGEVLPPERISVVNRGGGTLDWTVETSAPWVEATREGDEVVLGLRPQPGSNRANVHVRDRRTGMVRTIRVVARVRRPASDAPTPAPPRSTGPEQPRSSPSLRERQPRPSPDLIDSPPAPRPPQPALTPNTPPSGLPPSPPPAPTATPNLRPLAMGLALVGGGLVVVLLFVQVLGGLLDDGGREDRGGVETSDTTRSGPDGGDHDPVLAALQEAGEANPSCEGEADGALSIGGVLPETGDLSFLGWPMMAGAELAVADINAAGGVNGQPVEFANDDSGDQDPLIAPLAVDYRLQTGADVILGPASSAISLDVIDTIVAACRVQFSPANTALDFTTYGDDDLYFRTAPTDILQGRIQADLAMEDGGGDAMILASHDSYGHGIADYIQLFYGQSGAGEIVERRSYDPEAPEFSDEVEAVMNEDPDILFLVGFTESYTIIQGLLAQGFTPDVKRLYTVDGNTGSYAGDVITTPGALAGVRGTLPSAQISDQFSVRLQEQDPDLEDEMYGPETYDAVIVSALAAEAAGTDRPDEVARHINGVTRDGTRCTSFSECVALVGQGDDIDYDGVSGPLEFGRPGEPTVATYAVLAYGQDNRIDQARTEYRTVEV